MCARKRMERISWMNTVKNEEVLTRIRETRKILEIIKDRKRKCLGHWLRRTKPYGYGYLVIDVIQK